MKEEMKRIMLMVEEGKLSTDEAAELLTALKEERQEEQPESKQSTLGKMLKIRVTSDEKENVRLNIPIRFVKWILKTGHGIAAAIPDAKPYVEDVDMEVVMRAIDEGVEGKIIDIETDEGETVAIYIE